MLKKQCCHADPTSEPVQLPYTGIAGYIGSAALRLKVKRVRCDHRVVDVCRAVRGLLNRSSLLQLPGARARRARTRGGSGVRTKSAPARGRRSGDDTGGPARDSRRGDAV
eukprot:4495355-Prymnesium_polylepis.1